MQLVSVIVPVYNVEAYLADTIRSVLAQTYTNFEMIIVDDGSTDGSLDIARGFSDPRIKIVRQTNRGLAGARNTGIRNAQGEYLAFLDADDLWLTQKLALHVRHLQQNPQVGVSFCRSSFIDDTGNPLGINQMPKLTEITLEHLLCRNPIGNGSAPVIRREVFAAIEFSQNRYGSEETFYFDEDFRSSEDIECWVRIMAKTDWQIEGIPETLTLYRVNNQGLSANVDKQFDSWSRMLEKTREYAPELIADWGNKAKAYQYRYLARRAVRSQDINRAFELLGCALQTHWQIIIEEPRRTLITVAAVGLLKLLPPQLYKSLEAIAIKTTGRMQARKIQRQSSGEAQGT
jgi:glycosyltransferase involved in cell wall biosynthesis